MTNMKCPSHNEIRKCMVGDLPADVIDSIFEHVENCPNCRSVVETFDDDCDGLISRLRANDTDLPVTAACEQMILQAEVMLDIAPPSGRQRIRDYDLLSLIGQGGMGAVYRAKQIRLNRFVAIKVLMPPRRYDPQAVARFQREMELVGRLEHQNVVRALDAGEDKGVLYLVMELVEGLDLRQVLKRTGRLSIAEACEIARQTAEGLECVHRQGVVHRDIKPSNLMISSSGQVKILDLGLARLADDVDSQLTQTQAIGSVPFMAPEQAGDSHDVHASADIYSLGCTLYQLLCGEPPHGDGKYVKAVQIIQAHATLEPSPLNQLNSDIPAELADLVGKMLSKNPSQRPEGRALANALVRFAEGAELGRLVDQFVNEDTTVTLKKPPTVSVPRWKTEGRRSGGQRSNIRWLVFLTVVVLAVATSLLAIFLHNSVPQIWPGVRDRSSRRMAGQGMASEEFTMPNGASEDNSSDRSTKPDVAINALNQSEPGIQKDSRSSLPRVHRFTRGRGQTRAEFSEEIERQRKEDQRKRNEEMRIRMQETRLEMLSENPVFRHRFGVRLPFDQTFDDHGLVIRIQQSEVDGITITISESIDGMSRIVEAKAPDIRELHRKNPVAYRFYDKYRMAVSQMEKISIQDDRTIYAIETRSSDIVVWLKRFVDGNEEVTTYRDADPRKLEITFPELTGLLVRDFADHPKAQPLKNGWRCRISNSASRHDRQYVIYRGASQFSFLESSSGMVAMIRDLADKNAPMLMYNNTNLKDLAVKCPQAVSVFKEFMNLYDELVEEMKRYPVPFIKGSRKHS